MLDIPEDAGRLSVIDDAGDEAHVVDEPGATVGRRRIGWNCAPRIRYDVSLDAGRLLASWK